MQDNYTSELREAWETVVLRSIDPILFAFFPLFEYGIFPRLWCCEKLFMPPGSPFETFSVFQPKSMIFAASGFGIIFNEHCAGSCRLWSSNIWCELWQYLQRSKNQLFLPIWRQKCLGSQYQSVNINKSMHLYFLNLNRNLLMSFFLLLQIYKLLSKVLEQQCVMKSTVVRKFSFNIW